MRRWLSGLTLLTVAGCSSSPEAPGTTTQPPVVAAPLRTLFDSAPVGAGGGTLQYNKAGDALNGLTLTVPTDAFTTASTWTIVADSNVVVTLPAGFTQAGPALAISTNQGFAGSPITLKMPLAIGTTETVVPLYYNADTRKFEGIPTVDRTANYITLATKNFSTSATATGAPSQTALRAAAAADPVALSCERVFGGICIIFAKVPNTLLQGTFTSTFLPGRDDWEFSNYGDFNAPGGDCEGMSITAMYFHYYVLASGGLYHKYDASLSNQWDNVQGIRFAGAVQRDARVDTFDQLAAIIKNAEATNTSINSLASDWLVATLKLTGRPVLVALKKGTESGGHAVIVYAASMSGATATISFADPNHPGVARTMKFDSGVLAPVSLQLNAAVSPRDYDRAFALGVSAEVPIKSVDARYAEFKAKSASADVLPTNYSWITYNFATKSPDAMPDVVRTSYNKFLPGLLCHDCTEKVPGNNPADAQGVDVYDATGASPVALDVDGYVTLTPGNNTFVLAAMPRSPFSATKATGFLDSRSVTVNYTPGTFSLNVLTAPLNVVIGRAAADTVRLVRTNYLSPIAISAVSDAGITVTPGETSSSSDIATFTVNVPNTVAAGSTHIVTITATGVDVAPVKTTFAVVATATPSFSMSVQTAPVNVTSGTTTFTDNITIARSNFNGAITLSDSAAAGISLNFITQPGTSSTASFVVVVAASVAPGTYVVTITGTSSLAPKKTTFAVVVTAVPPAGYTFSVSAEPLNVEINHDPYPYTVTINRTAFSGAINVAATADDPGIVISPDSVANASTSVALTVRADALASVGTHFLTLRGAAIGRTDQFSQFVIVTSLPAGGVPTGIRMFPGPTVSVSPRQAGPTVFTAYLVDAQGNRTAPEPGWGIGILTDDSNVGSDAAPIAFDAVQRWQTHGVTPNRPGSSLVRAFYYRISNGQSTFLASTTLTVTP
ncbi:MAG: hypothetical protein ABJC26_13465 [Gemmatimonadaceae bacterium]